MNNNINNIVEAIKEEKYNFIKPLIKEDNLYKDSHSCDATLFFLSIFIIPLLSVFAWGIWGGSIFLTEHLGTFILQSYGPAFIYLCFRRKLFRSLSKKRFEKKSEKELFEEIEGLYKSIFYSQNISNQLHNKVKMALTMDEYKRLCYSGSDINNITYGQLKSFMHLYPKRQNDNKIIEDNKLSITLESEDTGQNKKENLNIYYRG